MRRRVSFGGMAAAVVLLAAGSVCLARENKILKVSLFPTVGRGRRNAPIPIQCILTNETHRLLEGQLDIRVIFAGDVVGRYRTPELALTTGDQAYRFTLPAMGASGGLPHARVEMAFVTQRGTIELDGTSLLLPDDMPRPFVVAVSSALAEANPVDMKLGQSLRFETFLKDRVRDGSGAMLALHDTLTPLEVLLAIRHMRGLKGAPSRPFYPPQATIPLK